MMPETFKSDFPMQDGAALQGAFAVLSDALDFTIGELRRSNGNLDGQWFTEFEAEIIRRAKGFTTEDISLDDEARLFRPAVAFLTGLVAMHRRSLEAPPESSP